MRIFFKINAFIGLAVFLCFACKKKGSDASELGTDALVSSTETPFVLSSFSISNSTNNEITLWGTTQLSLQGSCVEGSSVHIFLSEDMENEIGTSLCTDGTWNVESELNGQLGQGERSETTMNVLFKLNDEILADDYTLIYIRPGSLYSGFNGTGFEIRDMTNESTLYKTASVTAANEIFVLADRVVGGTNYYFNVIKYSLDGSMDINFGTGGIYEEAIANQVGSPAKLHVVEDSTGHAEALYVIYTLNSGVKSQKVIKLSPAGIKDASFASGAGELTFADSANSRTLCDFAFDSENDRFLLMTHASDGANLELFVHAFDSAGLTDATFNAGVTPGVRKIVSSQSSGIRLGRFGSLSGVIEIFATSFPEYDLAHIFLNKNGTGAATPYANQAFEMGVFDRPDWIWHVNLEGNESGYMVLGTKDRNTGGTWLPAYARLDSTFTSIDATPHLVLQGASSGQLLSCSSNESQFILCSGWGEITELGGDGFLLARFLKNSAMIDSKFGDSGILRLKPLVSEAALAIQDIAYNEQYVIASGGIDRGDGTWKSFLSVHNAYIVP